jgi:hypothetical protein
MAKQYGLAEVGDSAIDEVTQHRRHQIETERASSLKETREDSSTVETIDSAAQMEKESTPNQLGDFADPDSDKVG